MSPARKLMRKLMMTPLGYAHHNRGKTHLVMIRHGSTALNDGPKDQERVRGNLDVPMSPLGIQEVHKAVPKLKKLKLDGIVSSDMQRSQHTSQILSTGLGIPVIGATPALRPWDLGHLSGQNAKQMAPTIQSYIKNAPHQPVPGGESFNSFRQRIIGAVQQLQARHPGQKLGLVAHGSTERVVEDWERAGKPNDLRQVPISASLHKTGGISHGGFKVAS